MRAYISIFRMRLIAGMQYRAAAWAGVATQFFWGFMYIMIYEAFYRTGAEREFQWHQLISYIWLQQAFLSIIVLWFQDNDLQNSIANGHVAYELCRPYDLYSFWYARLMGLRLSRAALRCLPILLIAALLPAQYRMSPPAGFAAGGLFVFSLVWSLLLVIAISMFIYILTFITLSPASARLIVGVAADFLQGAIIPVPLMPHGLQTALNFLPFRYVSDLPFRLYSGSITGHDALLQVAMQIIWAVGLFILGHIAMDRVLRRAVIQGG